MLNTGSVGSGGGVKAEDVISKLKDDGDFDRLRLKIIRKLKENEELRSSIISVVKQSTALNRPGAESMKPRQLCDAIHEEMGDKLMNQVSDELWDIIRGGDGMQSEIKETVMSVYEKLSNSSGIKRKAIQDGDNLDCDAPPGFSSVSDEEDPDVPPGFG